jgi:hypothetical protein
MFEMKVLNINEVYISCPVPIFVRWAVLEKFDKDVWEGVTRIHVAQGRVQWRTLTNVVMNFRVP